MNDPTLTCQQEQRRHDVRQQKESWNGLDYLEVSEDQLTLTLFFLNKAPQQIKKENVIIEGGRRITDITIRRVDPCPVPDQNRDDCVVVKLENFGDFSTYTLLLVDFDPETGHPIMDTDSLGRQRYRPMPGIDPRYAHLDFSFKAGCPTDLDCLEPGPICPPEQLAEPEIDYLAKDYASFRQLILDRLALIMPGWQERHVPDLGITLVEILAYAGDYLSQYQDAVATEAYLQTARQRISVRRHARLVDYCMHEGCNARAWLHIEAGGDPEPLDPDEIFFVTGKVLPLRERVLSSEDLRQIPPSQYEVFEPLVERNSEFSPRDLKDAASLVARLRDPQDEHSQSLRQRFSAETEELLEDDAGGPPSDALRSALVRELNGVLLRSRLYEEELFRVPGLVAEARWLLERPLSEEKRRRLNRLILERTFRDEIAEHDKIYLYGAHDQINFYTWGDRECCLPKGATSAVLVDGEGKQEEAEPGKGNAKQTSAAQTHHGKDKPVRPDLEWVYHRVLNLQPGDFVLFEEALGPTTGEKADADPRHRHVVRLTRVEPLVDELLHQPLLAIEWDEQDALPFPLCISAIIPAKDCELKEAISVARGNMLLVDHGRRIDEDEDLGTVRANLVPRVCEGEDRLSEIQFEAVPFRPLLGEGPLTFRQSLPERTPASRLLDQDPHQALPDLSLKSIPPFIGSDGPEPLFPAGSLFDDAQLASMVTVLKQFMPPQEPEGTEYLRQLLSASTLSSLTAYEGRGRLPKKLEQAIKADLEQNLLILRALCELLTGQPSKECAVQIIQDEKSPASLQFGALTIPLRQARQATTWTTRYVRYSRLISHLSPGTRRLLDAYSGSGPLPENLATTLREDLRGLMERWTPVYDLLNSQADDRHFVVEIDNDRRAHLRFGDDELGRMPEAGTAFLANYRVGNGPAGNVGADTIRHIVFRRTRMSGAVLKPRNPFPARGGIAPESRAEVKLFAPHAFKTRLERAVTIEDYVELVMRGFNREAAAKAHASHALVKDSVQQAAATLRWNGSWYEVRVAVDPMGTLTADDDLLSEIATYLRAYKRMGHDLQVVPAKYVPLDIELKICVLPGYLSGHVEAELQARFSNRMRLDGTLGFFHPDNLTFGQGIRLSRLVAEARSLPGVEHVSVVKLQRFGEPEGDALEVGILSMGPLEIARLDNDPSFPENGLFRLEMVGGR